VADVAAQFSALSDKK
jgi:hypothetical protein